jgi:hypothetical protein
MIADMIRGPAIIVMASGRMSVFTGLSPVDRSYGLFASRSGEPNSVADRRVIPYG